MNEYVPEEIWNSIELQIYVLQCIMKLSMLGSVGFHKCTVC
jgi:hypothetical protein